MISGYHGTAASDLAAYIGLCITDDETAAEHYAECNVDSDDQTPTVLTVDIDTDTLTVETVDYDYDACEPILNGVTADVAQYQDCDEQGRTHTTWMLLTPAAIAATEIAA